MTGHKRPNISDVTNLTSAKLPTEHIANLPSTEEFQVEEYFSFEFLY